VSDATRVPARDDWQSLRGHIRMRNSPTMRLTPAAVAEYLGRMGFDISGGDPSRSLFDTLILDSFFVSHTVTPGIRVRWDRSRPSVARRYLFMFVLHGSITFHGTAPHFVSPAGDLLIAFPSDLPLTVTSPGPSDTLVFIFDSMETGSKGFRPNDIVPEQASTTMVRAALTYLTAITQPEVSDAVEDSTALRSTIREIARSLLSVLTLGGVELPIVTRAREMIASDFADPDLSAATIAKRLNVSRRTLDRHFSAQGAKVGTELRHARLDAMLRLLNDDPDISTVRLASSCGFGSAASLDRAATAVLGATIGKIRREVQEGPCKGPSLEA